QLQESPTCLATQPSREWPMFAFRGLLVHSRTPWIGVGGVLCALLAICDRGIGGEPGPDKIEFDRQIRPILAENCFACHGPDDRARKAKLRLDTKQGAFARLRGGGFALVAGNVSESELLQRIASPNADERMPPPKSGKKLAPQQVELVRQWIE